MASRHSFYPTSATPCHPQPQHWPPQRQDPPMPPTPSPHLRAPTRVHREANAHEPLLPAPDAHGALGSWICQATASPTPSQDVARRILGEDVTQIDYYTERVKRMVGKVHLQRHHPLRAGHLRPGGRGGTERRRYLAEGQRGGATTRKAAGALPPEPRCLPNAARRGGGLFAHAEACGFGHRIRHRTPISGSVKVRVLTRAKGRCECCGAGCCLATPASKGPGGGPHRAQEP